MTFKFLLVLDLHSDFLLALPLGKYLQAEKWGNFRSFFFLWGSNPVLPVILYQKTVSYIMLSFLVSVGR